MRRRPNGIRRIRWPAGPLARAAVAHAAPREIVVPKPESYRDAVARGIGLAAFGFLNPLIAAVIHVGSETAFILNSAQLPALDGGKKPANLASAPLATMEIRRASTPS